MRLLAREMNLSETAYLWPIEGGFSLRWLTPSTEVDLCGHATLAAAFVLWQTGILSPESAVRFSTRSGWIECTKDGDWIGMDFPSMPCGECPPPEGLERALGCEVLFCGFNGMDYLVEVSGEAALRRLAPDFGALANFPARGVIATAKAESREFDFVSRFFAPRAGVNEDPVTGSAHCALGPFWQPRLRKSAFSAFQASSRGGVVKLAIEGPRVRLMGQAVSMSRVDLLHWGVAGVAEVGSEPEAV